MGGFLFQHIIFFFCTLFFLVTFLKLLLLVEGLGRYY